MTEDRDLLPWILGALSMAAIATAIAIGLSARSSPAHALSLTGPSTLASVELKPKLSSSAAPAVNAPSPAAPSPAAPAFAATASTVQGAAPGQSLAALDQPANQIWECSVDGVKTFSNKRCGSAAVLRDVGPINVMDASATGSNVHWYGPDSNDAPDYSYPAPQAADTSYPILVGVPYIERRRIEHPHQPTRHTAGHIGAISSR